MSDECTVVMNGTITGFNSDAEARFGKALRHVAEDIEHDAGEFRGVAKVVFESPDGQRSTITLADLGQGVKKEGTIDPCERVHFQYSFTAAEVAESALGHTMFHALDDMGLDYEMDEDSRHFVHHHDHGHGHGHHHHHDGEECHCHDHEHGHDDGHHHEHHHHHDGEECHCHDHEHDHEHHHEATSIEQAGGCAVGLNGTIVGYGADAEERFAQALMQVGQWITDESGCLLGHIKAAIVREDGSGITLNLTDMENGVEHHGTLGPQDRVGFTFMCAVLDVDEHELRHRMYHAIDDTGLRYELEEQVECHCHDHGHHHDDDHHHGHGEGCRCPECEAEKGKESRPEGKKSFLDRLRRKKE